MNFPASATPLLPFKPTEPREYGSIRLFDSTSVPPSLPFSYSRFTVNPGQISRKDQHEVLEVWVILSGNGRLIYDGGEYAVKTGDAVQFETLRVHQIVNESSEDLTVFSFWWKRE
jgi:mannose-6-phosphate isomerase-like protein (cupin superfamily)